MISLGEAISYNPNDHNTAMLAEQGLLAVCSLDPLRVVFPGMDAQVIIDPDSRLRPDQTGAIYGNRNPGDAARQIVRLCSYREGLSPGSAGIYDDGSEVEALASPPAKAALLRRASQVPYVGYLCLVPKEGFEGRAEPFPNSFFTRRAVPVVDRVGLRLPDVAAFLGPRGIDGLRDPVDHPFVGMQLRTHGLRS